MSRVSRKRGDDPAKAEQVRKKDPCHSKREIMHGKRDHKRRVAKAARRVDKPATIAAEAANPDGPVVPFRREERSFAPGIRHVGGPQGGTAPDRKKDRSVIRKLYKELGIPLPKYYV